MMYILQDVHGHEYPVGVQLHIGRETTNQLVVADAMASRLHATAWEEGGKLFIRDENSANGTLVNGVRIKTTALNAGDQIQIGNTFFTVVRHSPESPATLLAQPPQVSKPVSPPPRRYAQPPQHTPPAAAPHPHVQAQPAAPQKSKRGCGRWLLIGCLLLVFISGAAIAGGYFAYQRGYLSLESILSLVGLGPADVEVDNFRDDAIQVYFLQLDPKPDTTAIEYSMELNPFDIRTYRIQTSGRYRVDFSAANGSADLGTCTLTVKSGDEYQFVALPDMIAINRVKDQVSNGRDLIITTSAWCR